MTTFRQTVLNRLSAEAGDLRRRFGVKDMAVFGSVARGDDHEGSDLDLLVTFEGKPDFDRFMGLKLYLEELFQRRIDLLTTNTLRPDMKVEVEREAVYVS